MGGLHRPRLRVEGRRDGADGRLSLHRLSRKASRSRAAAERFFAPPSVQQFAGDRAADRAARGRAMMDALLLVLIVGVAVIALGTDLAVLSAVLGRWLGRWR